VIERSLVRLPAVSLSLNYLTLKITALYIVHTYVAGTGRFGPRNRRQQMGRPVPKNKRARLSQIDPRLHSEFRIFNATFIQVMNRWQSDHFHTISVCSVEKVASRAPLFPRQSLPNSAAQFVKFREILWHCYPQITYIPRPVGIVVLTDDNWMFKV